MILKIFLILGVSALAHCSVAPFGYNILENDVVPLEYNTVRFITIPTYESRQNLVKDEILPPHTPAKEYGPPKMSEILFRQPSTTEQPLTTTTQEPKVAEIHKPAEEYGPPMFKPAEEYSPPMFKQETFVEKTTEAAPAPTTERMPMIKLEEEIRKPAEEYGPPMRETDISHPFIIPGIQAPRFPTVLTLETHRLSLSEIPQIYLPAGGAHIPEASFVMKKPELPMPSSYEMPMMEVSMPKAPESPAPSYTPEMEMFRTEERPAPYAPSIPMMPLVQLPPGLPELPPAPVVPELPKMEFREETISSTTEQPSAPYPAEVTTEQPLAPYPPAMTTKPSVMLPPGLPELPAAPVVPKVEMTTTEMPSAPYPPAAPPQPQLPPTLPELPAAPSIPKVSSTTTEIPTAPYPAELPRVEASMPEKKLMEEMMMHTPAPEYAPPSPTMPTWSSTTPPMIIFHKVQHYAPPAPTISAPYPPAVPPQPQLPLTLPELPAAPSVSKVSATTTEMPTAPYSAELPRVETAMPEKQPMEEMMMHTPAPEYAPPAPTMPTWSSTTPPMIVFHKVQYYAPPVPTISAPYPAALPYSKYGL